MKLLKIFNTGCTIKCVFLSIGLLSLFGCAGPPAQHYTLSLSTSHTAEPNTPALTGRSVQLYTLSDISVPAEADNVSLVVRQGDGRLMVLGDDRWTGSLSSQLSTAISQSLTQRVGMPPVQKLVAEAANSTVTKIQLDVQRFDLVPGQYVVLDAVWSVRAAGAKTYLTCYTRLQQTVGVGVLALVQGQQRNVQALSAQIAQALVSETAPAESSCTTSRAS